MAGKNDAQISDSIKKSKPVVKFIVYALLVTAATCFLIALGHYLDLINFGTASEVAEVPGTSATHMYSASMQSKMNSVKIQTYSTLIAIASLVLAGLTRLLGQK